MEFLKVREVAEFFKVSEATIYNWMVRENDPIPAHKQGRNTRFLKDEIIEWFKKK